MATNARVTDKRVSIHPYFQVKDGKMENFKAGFLDFYNAVDRESNCMHYSFSYNEAENRVFNREAYDSAEGLIKHIENTGDAGASVEMLHDGDAIVLEIMCPEEDVKKLEPIAKEMNAKIWVMDPDGFTNQNMEKGTDKCVSIHPYFTIKPESWEAFKGCFGKYYERVKNEPGCHHYCFAVDEENKMVFNREQYVDADALMHHIENTAPVNEITGPMIESVKLEIHGPESELAKLKSWADENGASLWTLDDNARIYRTE